MSFSRERELIRTQERILKQRVKVRRRKRLESILHMESSLAESELQPFENELKHGTIFVSIPSYRDPECSKTLADCFDKAKYPGRVFVGVCQQNEVTDEDCLASVTAQHFLPNIRVLRISADEARGPVYARALIEQNLYRDESYYMLIDSHTLFVPGWDEECIKQLALCNSMKPVLTCYPAEYDIKTRQMPVHQNATFLKFRDFHPRIGFTQQDPVRYKFPPPRPQPSLLWGAGFSFTLGEVIKTVPYDINLQYVFLGEEISMAARLWTSGYDLFAPMTNIVFHHSSRVYRPVFWEKFYKKNGKSLVPDEVREERKRLEAQGNARIHSLLTGAIPPGSDQWGLGTERTLIEFQEYTGIDFISKSAARHARLGLSPHADEEEKYSKYGIQSFH